MAQAATATDNLKERIQQALEKEPWQMTPVLARMLNSNEAEVLRHWPNDDVTELDGARASELIQELDKLGKAHVICSNGDCVLESYGHFGGYSITGGFLNVQTSSLDMHIHYLRIKYVFAMIKPSHTDGQKTYSFQFFNQEGRSIFKAFVYKTISEADGAEIEQRVAAWEELKNKYLPAAV